MWHMAGRSPPCDESASQITSPSSRHGSTRKSRTAQQAHANACNCRATWVSCDDLCCSAPSTCDASCDSEYPTVISCTSVAIIVSESLVLALSTSSATLGLPSNSYLYSFDRQPPRWKGSSAASALSAASCSTDKHGASCRGPPTIEHFVNRSARRVASESADACSFCFTVERPFLSFFLPSWAGRYCKSTTIARKQFDVRVIRVTVPDQVQLFPLRASR
mmetsp:Transcript_24338/g.60345  ORF Transcript_24338/g.60345 Transcript_24338/m.60345 type:complete len:220 (-) Transcript_24338:137-796(-)